MKNAAAYLLFAIVLLASSCQKSNYLKIAVTTDVHGMIFPMDLIEMETSDHSLAHVHTYLQQQRAASDTTILLLDNGDFLQGQPTVYFFNTQKSDQLHISAAVMNYMGYDAGTVGNHDIETGPEVYYKVEDEFNFPWLAANAVNIHTGEPQFEPYTLFRKSGKKIAILGLITPGIPQWLPKSLWPDLRFDDMVTSAKYWIPLIREKENPDLIIGLFHSGTDHTYGGRTLADTLNENATLLVAKQVPGFDIIFAGHDHKVSTQWINNVEGDSVLVIDPGSHARYIGEALVDFSANGSAKISGRLIQSKQFVPDQNFLSTFDEQFQEVQAYLFDTVTNLAEPMNSRDGLFGPSSFITLIHHVQIKESGADISLTAPLAFNTTLAEGPVRVSDMFKLYRFENMLYTMKLTGKEIDDFLEHAAALWFNTMSGPDDHLLIFDTKQKGRLKHPYYNFSSAAGIDYTIDLRKPKGEKVVIHQKSDGSEFAVNDTFLVALNSYRGNGGGGHLTSGAGIRKEELTDRIVKATQIDLRYHLMQYLGARDIYQPDTFQNWEFLPEEWHHLGEKLDRNTLFY